MIQLKNLTQSISMQLYKLWHNNKGTTPLCKANKLLKYANLSAKPYQLLKIANILEDYITLPNIKHGQSTKLACPKLSLLYKEQFENQSEQFTKAPFTFQTRELKKHYCRKQATATCFSPTWG
jgi:hypothetical protein